MTLPTHVLYQIERERAQRFESALRDQLTVSEVAELHAIARDALTRFSVDRLTAEVEEAA